MAKLPFVERARFAKNCNACVQFPERGVIPLASGGSAAPRRPAIRRLPRTS